jgi:5-methylcytosine-specific restriction endonuclease McrA
MTIKVALTPHENYRVMDLVAATGMNVKQWSESKNGPVKVPASNPAYCYEWSFIEPGQFVILNVWHSAIEERNGKAWCDLNMREWSEKGRKSRSLLPSEKSSLSKRALRMDHAIAYAFNNQLPIRVIVGEGSQRDISNLQSKRASRMKLRLLDPEAWSVQRYSARTGECRLSRGSLPRFVDQFTAPVPRPPHRRETSGEVWERDRKVRENVLTRAKGICECCGAMGFRMIGGSIYLETHHVIALSEGGSDDESNVVAICPNNHREAHHGERREIIKNHLRAILAQMYGRRN